MGQLDLLRQMYLQRYRDLQRCRRKAQAPSDDGLIVSQPKRKCTIRQRDDSQGGEIDIYSGPNLPEMADTPMLHSRYLHLKNLSIVLTAATFPATYDYFSLVSFLDACPSLETFVLDVSQRNMEHLSIFTDASDLRQMREQHHDKIKSVKILGFTSAKSLVELTCYIVESITSLECLTLETHQSSLKCFVPEHKSNKCSPLPKAVLREAHQALLAIGTYIEPKVPSKVTLHVVKTCRQCHTV